MKTLELIYGTVFFYGYEIYKRTATQRDILCGVITAYVWLYAICGLICWIAANVFGIVGIL
jgi:hypothetical protein